MESLQVSRDEETAEVEGRLFTRTDLYAAKDIVEHHGFDVFWEIVESLRKRERETLEGAPDLANDQIRETRGGLRMIQAISHIPAQINDAVIDLESDTG